MNQLQFSQLPSVLKQHLALRGDSRNVIRGITLSFLGVVPIMFVSIAPAGMASCLLTFLGLVIGSAGFSLITFCGSCLVYTHTSSRVSTRMVYYEKHHLEALRDGLLRHDWPAILSIPSRSCASQLCMRVFAADDNSFAAVQLLEYVPYEYVPLDSPCVLTDRQASGFIDAICRYSSQKNVSE